MTLMRRYYGFGYRVVGMAFGGGGNIKQLVFARFFGVNGGDLKGALCKRSRFIKHNGV